MPDVMQVEVVSPERVLFSGEAAMVITRTLGGGEIAFMPGHAPFLAALTENHTRINLDGGTTVHVAVHGGFVEVSNSKVSILSDVAELADNIDVDRAIAARDRAQDVLRRGDDVEAEAALRRADARLAATGRN
jgi:F-type H+-transporting ATPase subunit epsilon